MQVKFLHGDVSRIATDVTPFNEGSIYITYGGDLYVDLNIGTTDSPNNQRICLNSVAQQNKFDVVSLAYPVGSIYLSMTSTNPGVLFGVGEWERIEDTFLLASGNIYSAGSTGGEAEHTLTVTEMPSHTHTYKRHEFDRTDTDPDTGEDVYGANNKTLGARMGTTESSGGSQPHNNMPPYLAVYVWKRVA